MWRCAAMTRLTYCWRMAFAAGTDLALTTKPVYRNRALDNRTARSSGHREMLK